MTQKKLFDEMTIKVRVSQRSGRKKIVVTGNWTAEELKDLLRRLTE